MKQIAEARRARLKLLNPHTPHDEWVLLSRRKNVMIDAEDAQTTLFKSDGGSGVANDLTFVEERNKADIPETQSAEEVRLSATKLTAKDTIARLLRTLAQDQTTPQDLGCALDLDSDGTISLAELHAGVHEHGMLLSECEMTALMHELDIDGDGSVSVAEFVRALETEGATTAERV